MLYRELDVELNDSLSPELFPRQDALSCEYVSSLSEATQPLTVGHIFDCRKFRALHIHRFSYRTLTQRPQLSLEKATLHTTCGNFVKYHELR